MPTGPLTVTARLIEIACALWETTALPESTPGLPIVKPDTAVEGWKNVEKLKAPVKLSLIGSIVTLPEVLRFSPPNVPENSSARITMFADEVRSEVPPKFETESQKLKFDLSLVVPVPRASRTMDDVTA